MHRAVDGCTRARWRYYSCAEKPPRPLQAAAGCLCGSGRGGWLQYAAPRRRLMEPGCSSDALTCVPAVEGGVQEGGYCRSRQQQRLRLQHSCSGRAPSCGTLRPPAASGRRQPCLYHMGTCDPALPLGRPQRKHSTRRSGSTHSTFQQAQALGRCPLPFAFRWGHPGTGNRQHEAQCSQRQQTPA